MARVLFLNRSFWPDTDVTGVLLSELAEDLAAEHEVTVICGPANTSKGRWWPPLRRESYGAVKVVRTFGSKLTKKNLALRIARLCIYLTLAAIAALRERPDVIIAETDPPPLGLIGAMMKLLTGCRFIYYCQDLYPDILGPTGALRNGRVFNFVRWCRDRLLRRADAIVVLAEDMADRLRNRGIPRESIVVIPNWIDCFKVRPQPRCPDSLNYDCEDFVVMYAGNLGWSQNLESVLEAATLMRDNRRVKFVIVGDGARKAVLERAAAGLHNMEFIGHRHPSAMSDVLAAGDLHLIPLTAGAAGCLVPSKVYGILAAGRPFVAMMESEAEVARLASEFEVGFVVPPGDAHALARTISDSMQNRARLDDMGRRARVLAEQQYDRRLVTHRFAEFLKTMVPVRDEAVPMPIESVVTTPIK